jgi:hypothetical protein
LYFITVINKLIAKARSGGSNAMPSKGDVSMASAGSRCLGRLLVSGDVLLLVARGNYWTTMGFTMYDPDSKPSRCLNPCEALFLMRCDQLSLVEADGSVMDETVAFQRIFEYADARVLHVYMELRFGRGASVRFPDTTRLSCPQLLHIYEPGAKGFKLSNPGPPSCVMTVVECVPTQSCCRIACRI